MKKEIIRLFFFAAIATGLAACNSNDDGVEAGVEIPGITVTEDTECCSAEEAFQVYKLLETLKEIPELALEVDGRYDVHAYSTTGKLHQGYNDLYFVATKKASGNYIKDFRLTSVTPLMNMVKMGMKHSTPTGGDAVALDDPRSAVKHTWVSFVMSTSEAGTWALSYNAQVLGKRASLEDAAITVDALAAGQEWLKSFKVGSDTYYLSLVNPTQWITGTNDIRAYVSKKSSVITTPYAQAEEKFTIEIDPRMPDMGSHSSPGNVALTPQADGSYLGTVNLTMTGLWRIYLTVKDSEGNVVAGGDYDSGGTLYWDVTK